MDLNDIPLNVAARGYGGTTTAMHEIEYTSVAIAGLNCYQVPYLRHDSAA